MMEVEGNTIAEQPGQPPPVTREQFPEPQSSCELCAAPAALRVVRWTVPTPDEPDRVPQQSHWYCEVHEAQAAQMEEQLWAAWRRRRTWS